MADAPTIRWWQSLTTLEADQIAKTDPVVILPLAAVEQHGPHLPLSTDLDIGLGLIEEAYRVLPRDFPAWVLPPQAVGCSREHTRFAGTPVLVSTSDPSRAPSGVLIMKKPIDLDRLLNAVAALF